MVLAAGLGTRMRPLTTRRPKPALPALNRPLVAHVLEHLAGHGVTFAVVNLHSLPDVMEEAVSRWQPPDMQIVFSREKEILGTAGGLRKAARHFKGEPLFLVNSDSLSDADLGKAARDHAEAGRLATMVVRPHHPAEGYRPLEVARAGGPVPRVTGLAGKRWGQGEPRTFSGVHVLDPRVLEAIPSGRPVDIVSEVYLEMLGKDRDAVGAWLHEGWWFEAGNPWRYRELNMAMLARSQRGSVFGPGFFLDEEARVERSVVGAGCRLMGGAVVSDSVLWENVAVGENVSLTRCVVTDGVSLAMGSSWADSLLMDDGEGGVDAHPMEAA